MKRIVMTGSVLVLALAGIGSATAGTEDGQGAQKSALTVNTGSGMSECEAGAQREGKGVGFVNLNAPGQEGAVTKILGTVSLKEGTPETAYDVRLGMLVGEDTMCMPTMETLETNSNGHGNAHFEVPFDLADEYFVVLSVAGAEEFASAPVPLR